MTNSSDFRSDGRPNLNEFQHLKVRHKKFFPGIYSLLLREEEPTPSELYRVLILSAAIVRRGMTESECRRASVEMIIEAEAGDITVDA